MSTATKNNKIAFLINPVSGTSGTRKQAAELLQYLNSQSALGIYQPTNPAEFIEIAKDLIQQNYTAIFGCGGDGTLNLLSNQLKSSETAMGIIPLGSGNGFARHHKIPMRWEKALKVLDSPNLKICDTGLVNDFHFLNVAGIGYAAKISHAFKAVTKRGLSGYAKTVIKNLNRENFNAKLISESGVWEGETWMVDFCNGSQWGNNFRLAPTASSSDGELNTVVFKKMNSIKVPVLALRFAANSIPQSMDIYSTVGNEFKIEFDGIRPLHTDGEPIAMLENNALIEVVPKVLKVWTL